MVVLLSQLPSPEQPMPHLLFQEARRLPMRGVHELLAKLQHMTDLLMLQLTVLDVQTCTFCLCLCCVTIPLIIGKISLIHNLPDTQSEADGMP